MVLSGCLKCTQALRDLRTRIPDEAFSDPRNRLIWVVLKCARDTGDTRTDCDSLTEDFVRVLSAQKKQPINALFWLNCEPWRYLREVLDAALLPHDAYVYAACLLEFHRRDRALEAMRIGIELLTRRGASAREALAAVEEYLA
jgi:hypothetical protein